MYMITSGYDCISFYAGSHKDDRLGQLVVGLVAAAVFLLGSPSNTHAQADSLSATERHGTGFEISGYGSLNYFYFDWDTDPSRRNAVDVERLVFYPSYFYDERFSFRAEVEIEHGGTGATMEFDRFEEFGEFESEIEAGGEVLLEQAHIEMAFSHRLNLRIGRFKLPIGIATFQDEPSKYFTTTRSPAEVALIPTNWYEIGLQAHGRLGAFGYAVSVVNGLDATGFSSATWVVRGHQKRFETINAEEPALALRLDWFYLGDRDSRIGVSFYRGGSADNRPKPDLDVPAAVTVVDGHVTFDRGPVRANALVLFGHLQNAGAVTSANRNLSNNLNVKRTPVGTTALAYYGELGYDIASLLLTSGPKIVVFGRYEFYDTMHTVDTDVFDNPRWERTAVTFGLNGHVHRQIVLKTEYNHRWLGQVEQRFERTFSAGVGFEF
jgi:hypothetical protein